MEYKRKIVKLGKNSRLIHLGIIRAPEADCGDATGTKREIISDC